MLKDLPFYEVAHLADSEAHQACVEEREKKRQDGTLWQGPIASRPISSSATCSPAKKKKTPVVRPF